MQAEFGGLDRIASPPYQGGEIGEKKKGWSRAPLPLPSPWIVPAFRKARALFAIELHEIIRLGTLERLDRVVAPAYLKRPTFRLFKRLERKHSALYLDHKPEPVCFTGCHFDSFSMVGRDECRDWLPDRKTTAVPQKGDQIAQTTDEPRIAVGDHVGSHEGKLATI